jgi:hypothetical protein
MTIDIPISFGFPLQRRLWLNFSTAYDIRCACDCCRSRSNWYNIGVASRYKSLLLYRASYLLLWRRRWVVLQDAAGCVALLSCNRLLLKTGFRLKLGHGGDGPCRSSSQCTSPDGKRSSVRKPLSSSGHPRVGTPAREVCHSPFAGTPISTAFIIDDKKSGQKTLRNYKRKPLPKHRAFSRICKQTRSVYKTFLRN